MGVRPAEDLFSFSLDFIRFQARAHRIFEGDDTSEDR